MLKAPRSRHTRTFVLFALGLVAQAVIVGIAVHAAGPASALDSVCDPNSPVLPPVTSCGDVCDPNAPVGTCGNEAFCVDAIVGCSSQQMRVTSSNPHMTLEQLYRLVLRTGGGYRGLRVDMGFVQNPGVAEFVSVTPSAGCTVEPTEITCELTARAETFPELVLGFRALRAGSATIFVDITPDGGKPFGTHVMIAGQANPSPSDRFTVDVFAPMAAQGPYEVMLWTQSPTPILNLQGIAELFTQPPAAPGDVVYGPITITPPGTVNRPFPDLFNFDFRQPPSGTATSVNLTVPVITLVPTSTQSLGDQVDGVGPLAVSVPTLQYNGFQVQVDGAGPIRVFAPTVIVSNGVTIVAADATATEAGLTTGTFTVRRTGVTTAPLTVFFTVGGTAASGLDYIALPVSVTIPAGALSANITVTPKPDLLTERTETVVVTLAARPTYNVGTPSSATVSITSGAISPVVTVVATDPTATEAGLTTGRFTVRRTGLPTTPLTVFFTVGGTAARGLDYVALPVSVTIPAGALSAFLLVGPKEDALMEGTETVVLTLSPRPNYTLGPPSSATVNIISNEVVTVMAMDPVATEAGLTTGTFKVGRTGNLAAPLTVFYTLGGTATRTGPGTDYAPLSGSVTIRGGQPSALVTVTPNDDPLMEGTETVVLTLAARPNYTLGAPSSATVNIISNEVVTVMATDPTATEAGNTTGRFTVSRTGLATPLTVFYTLSGTAVRGSDYVITPPPPVAGRVVIPAGLLSVSLTVTPNNDALPERTETVVLALIPQPTYTVGPPSVATVTITSNE